MNQTMPGPQGKKRAYHKPELVQVPLRPEEAVLGNCKNSASSGPIKSRCLTPLPACSSQGS